MKLNYAVLLLCSLFLCENTLTSGQIFQVEKSVLQSKNKSVPEGYKHYKPERLKNVPPGQYTRADWAEIIDGTWGPGLPDDEKLSIFDNAWNLIDQGFGAFMNMYINLDSLRNVFRPEIEAGVSRGRFAAILNYLGLALMDQHTYIIDIPVNLQTYPSPGTPLLVLGAATSVDYFGAALTPLADSTLLVYNVLPNHVLGLQPGDIVLGYDGVPWKQLYKQLLDAQLPCILINWGSSNESRTHSILQSAGLNWHLFETIDILKYNTKEIVHLSTSLLQNQQGEIFGNEQLPVPGVDFPDIYHDDYVSWGIIEGTTIGYIYSWSWYWWLDVSDQFYDAVYNLMYNYETTGIIIDSRLNYGGDMRQADAGYSLLFNQTHSIIAFDNRGNPNDHYDMVPSATHPSQLWILQGDPASFYDKPIAYLMGPNSISNGDWESVRIQYHPMTRTFGKFTNGAFTINDNPDLGNTEFAFSRATGSGYMINGHRYMAHLSAELDQEVWLTPDDVANGDDNVVKTALEWLQNSVFAYNINLDKNFVENNSDNLSFTATVQNRNNHNIQLEGMILNSIGIAVDSTLMYDDGNHNDGGANDGLWGGRWIPGPDEQNFSFKTKLTDDNAATVRYDFNINKFTTKGPVVIDGYTFVSTVDTLINPGENVPLRIVFKNNGSLSEVDNLTFTALCLDTAVISYPSNPVRINNVLPGGVNTSSLFTFKLSDDFQGDRHVLFYINIYSNNVLYWKDTLAVYVSPTGINEDSGSETPKDFALFQNYPNPFNSSTSVKYQLPFESPIKLKIYNILGQEIKTLVDGYRHAGHYSEFWNGTDDNEIPVVSGIYFIRIQAGIFSDIIKMVLMK